MHSLSAIKKDPVDLAALFGYSDRQVNKMPPEAKNQSLRGYFVVVLLFFLKEF